MVKVKVLRDKIKIEVSRDKEGFIWQFIVKGHAGFDKVGKDIVCAAVSVTAYNAVGALEELAGLKNFYSEKDGFMLCSIPLGLSLDKKETVRVILETTVIGFKQIELSYRKYVSVLDEEV
jgi:uncharacterized protein